MEKTKVKDKRISFNFLGMLGILLLSCIPLMRTYLPDAELILYWNEKAFSLIGRRPGFLIWTAALFVSQILTLFSVYFMDSSFFDKDEDGEKKALIATLLIMFAPSRFYMTFVKYDVSEIVLWILIPIVIGALIKGSRKKSVLFIFISVLSMMAAVPVFAFKYVYTVKFFSENGYAFGQLFSTLFFKDVKPGIGIPIILAACTEAGCIMAGYEKKDKKALVLFITAIVLTAMSLICFPWDVICRMSDLFRKVILHFGSPAFFIGPASMCFAILGAKGIVALKKSKNDFISEWLGKIICVLAVLVWIFLCNETIYYQYMI